MALSHMHRISCRLLFFLMALRFSYQDTFLFIVTSSSDGLPCETHLIRMISAVRMKHLKEASDLVWWYLGKCINFER